MTGACIVWSCPRSAVVSGAFCKRHDPAGRWQDRDAEYDAAYMLAEGLTLAEIAALTSW